MIHGGGLVTDAALKFTDAAIGDYSIRSHSVARNAGWSDTDYLATIGETDLLGNPRIHQKDSRAAVIDIGAYEFSGLPKGFTLFIK